MDFVLCVDQSDSMNGWDSVPATDPKGIRIDASKYFINNLAQRSESEPFLKIGLIEFGTDAHLLANLTEVTSATDDPGRKNLADQLQQKSLGYTNFIDTLKLALNSFERGGTFKNNRKPIIVIFTDGEPDDPRGLSTEAYFQELIDFYKQNLKEKGVEIFVIGVDTVGEAWGRTKPFWESFVPQDHIFYLKQMEELNYTFNQVIWKVFYLPSVQPDIISQNSLNFSVQPYLEKIQFDIYPEGEGNLEVSIFGPDGHDISQGPNYERKDFEKYYTIIVKDPPPGTWRYEITKGEGKVIVYKTLLPIVMSLVSPQDPHPFGRPISVVASFQKKDGSEVKELPQYPLRFTGTLIQPDGESIPFLLKKQDSGLFIWEETFSPEKPGLYKIMLSVQGREGYEVKSEYNINVLEIPYILPSSPAEKSVFGKFQKSLELSVYLALKGERVSPEGLFADNPNALMVAEIVKRPDNDLSQEKAVYLDYDPSSNSFHAVLPTDLNREGSYTLKVELEGRMVDGNLIKDQVPLIFEVRVPFWNQPWFPYIPAGIFVFIILTSWVVMAKKPRLAGTLYWQGEPYSLFGKRKFTIGGTKCNLDLNKPEIKGVAAVLLPRREIDDEGNRVIFVEVRFKGGETQVIADGGNFRIPDVEGSFEYSSGD